MNPTGSPTDETKYRILNARILVLFVLLGAFGYYFFYNKYYSSSHVGFSPAVSQNNEEVSVEAPALNDSNPVRTISTIDIPSIDKEYGITRPIFEIGNGDVITTVLINASSTDLMMESAVYLRRSDTSIKEITKANLMGRILQVIPDRSDSKRVLFTEIPDGIGGYILSRIVPSLYSVDLTNNFKVTKLGDKKVYTTVRTFFDVTNDNRYLAVSVNANNANIVDTPAIIDRNTGKIAKITTYNTKEFPLVVDMVFSEDEKILTLVLARNNPDAEEFATSTVNWQGLAR